MPSEQEWSAIEASLAASDGLAGMVAEPMGEENFGRLAMHDARGSGLNYRQWQLAEHLAATGSTVSAPGLAKGPTGRPRGRPKTPLTPTLRDAISQKLGAGPTPPPREALRELKSAGVPVVVLAKYFQRDRRTIQRWMSH